MGRGPYNLHKSRKRTRFVKTSRFLRAENYGTRKILPEYGSFTLLPEV